MPHPAFSPDLEVYNAVGGGAYFRRLLGEWERLGATVRSCEAVSDARYRAAAGRLGRLALRWRMYPAHAWHCWRAARKSRTKFTLRVVTTNPFVAPALVARAAGGAGATINLLYDLYPEALVLAGALRRASWAEGRCAAITRYALRHCAATVFLGERLRRHAEAAHGPARRACVIPVGADGEPFRRTPPERRPGDPRPGILYSGQMGRMHDLDTLAAVWGSPEADRVTWRFQAVGPGYTRWRAAAADRAGVTWGGMLGDDAWARAMREADVALVTVAPGAERVVMPSKTYSALVAGQAILAVCRRDSDLADLVHRHDCGWVVEPGDGDALRAVLASIAGDPAGLHRRRGCAFAAGHEIYDAAVVARTWWDLFGELAQAGAGPGLAAARRPAPPMPVAHETAV